jgi:hypothetical protein
LEPQACLGKKRTEKNCTPITDLAIRKTGLGWGVLLESRFGYKSGQPHSVRTGFCPCWGCCESPILSVF